MTQARIRRTAKATLGTDAASTATDQPISMPPQARSQRWALTMILFPNERTVVSGGANPASGEQVGRLRNPKLMARLLGCLVALAVGATACGADPDAPSLAEPIACVTAPAGLEGWWTFDEPVNGTWEDTVGGNELTEGSSTLVQANSNGKVDGAVDIPAGAYLKAKTALSPGTTNFSLDAWVRVEQPNKPQTIVGSSDNSTGTGFWLGTNGSNWELQLSTGPGKSQSFTSKATITAGEWHFVAVTVNLATSEVHFIIDGTKETPAQPLTSANPSYPNPGSTAIGYDPYANAANTTTISVDELEYFTRALDPQELIDIHSADTAGKCKTEPIDEVVAVSCTSKAVPGAPISVGAPVDFAIEIVPATANAVTVDWSAKHAVSGTSTGSGATYTYSPTALGKVDVSASVVVGSATFNVTCGTFTIGAAASPVATCTPSVALPQTFAVGDSLGLSATYPPGGPQPVFTWTFSPGGTTLNGPAPSYTFASGDAAANYSIELTYVDPVSNVAVSVPCGVVTIAAQTVSLSATCEPQGMVGEIAPGMLEVQLTSSIAAVITPKNPPATVNWTAENLLTGTKTTFTGNPLPGSFFVDEGEYKLTALIDNGSVTTTLDCGIMVMNR